MQDETTNREGAAEINQDEALQRGHEESLAATQDLARQVEAAEQAEGKPTPSQADADETAGTGI